MTLGYIRVSTPRQASGTSLQDQRAALISEGCEKLYEDVFTGVSLARPQFDLMCAEAAPGDTIVVTRLDRFSRSFFADSSIHACLFRSLLLRLLSFDFSLCIFLAQAGQYFDMPERGTYSTPHTVQFLGFNAVHRFVGVICNSPTKPMNL